MKKLEGRCGAALLEILISIALLGLLVVPISSGLMTALGVNGRSDELMQARLAVSSAAETIMSTGVESAEHIASFDFDDVSVESPVYSSGCWTLTVRSKTCMEVCVEISVRKCSLRTPEVSDG